MSAEPRRRGSTGAARWEEVRRRLDRRAAGRALIAIGAFGILVTVAGTVSAFLLLEQLEESVGESLGLTSETLVTLDQTLDVADELVGDVRTGLTTAGEGLTEVSGSVAGVADLADTLGATAQGLPERVATLDRALGDLADVAGLVDDALRTLSALPIGPDYDPAAPIDESIEDVRAEVLPIADELAAIGADLEAAAPGLAGLDDDLAALAGDVAALEDTLVEADGLLDDYRDRTATAEEIASDTRDDLGGSIGLAKVMVVLLGVTLGLGQLVPLWVGREVLAELDAARRPRLPEGGAGYAPTMPEDQATTSETSASRATASEEGAPRPATGAAEAPTGDGGQAPTGYGEVTPTAPAEDQRRARDRLEGTNRRAGDREGVWTEAPVRDDTSPQEGDPWPGDR